MWYWCLSNLLHLVWSPGSSICCEWHYLTLFNGRVIFHWPSLVIHLPMQELWVQSLGREDPWRRTRKPTPVFLSGKFPRTEEPGRYSPWDCKRVRHDLVTKQHFIVYMYHFFFIHFPIDEHLRCFYVLVIVNTTEMNIGWGSCILSNHIFLQIYAQKWDCWVIWPLYF